MTGRAAAGQGCAVRRSAAPSRWTRGSSSEFRSLVYSLASLVLALPASTSGTSCDWLGWHPQNLAADDTSAINGTLIRTAPHVCAEYSYITDFYTNLTQVQGTPAVGSINARCSDGNYLGYLSMSGANSPEDLPPDAAQSYIGFDAINGSASGNLESVGSVLDPAHAWDDTCPPGSLIIGYQITFVTGEVKQIRFLCSPPDTSGCGVAPVAAPGPKPNGIRAGQSTAPSPSVDQTYVVFAIQYSLADGGSLTTAALQSALRELSMVLLSSLVSLGPDCSTPPDVWNATVECFQAGPVPQDQSLQMIRSLNTAISAGAFNKAISNMGIAISSSQFVFAALTSRSAADFLDAHPPTAPAAPPKTIVGTSSDSSQTGIIAGSAIAGCAALAAAALLVAWLVLRSRRRRQQRQPEEGDAKDSPQPEPSVTPPSPDQHLEDVKAKSMLWRCKSPFADTVQSSEKLGWVTETSWDVENQNSEASKLARQQRASKLAPGVSAPVPATQAFDRSEPESVLWAAQPPAFSQQPPWWQSTVEQTTGKSWHRLTQDSDEVLDAEQGGSAWKVMHEEVADPCESRESGPLHSAQPLVVELTSIESYSSEEPALRSLERRMEDWQIQPHDLQICRHPDGRYVELGTGAFGKVYKALLNEVTEVAVKGLEASSNAQRTLFLREIEIHKRCRSAHVVQFLGACIQQDRMMLVTELMQESLYMVVHDEEKPFQWEPHGQRIALDVAQALAYLHKQRVVHLDIKSSNVLLTREGRAKIADVGLSQVLQNTYLSQVEGWGTLPYAAPELLYGGSNCSTQADIWSFGVLLHEMVSREHPKRGALSDIRPEQCPAHVNDLIYQCIKREPAERPPAKAIVKVLQAATPEEARSILAANLGPPTLGSSGQPKAARKLSRWASMPERQAPVLERWSLT